MSLLSGNEAQYGSINQAVLDSVDVPEPAANGNESSSLDEESSGLSSIKASIIIFSVTGIPFSANVCTGLLILGLPVIAEDLKLPDHLLLLPSSIYPLTNGCCLLAAGAIADHVGDRLVNLVGTFLLTVFVLANAFARNGIELIICRAIQGIGISMCMPTAVSIMTRTLPAGRMRNIAFSSLGVAQPIGFSLGLVIQGWVEVATGGWRLGYYVCTGIFVFLFLCNLLCLPKNEPREDSSFTSIATTIDWMGLLIAGSSLGLISYACTILAEDPTALWHGGTLAMVIVALALLAAFFFWMNRQETRGKPALIPNSLWRKVAFSAMSITVFMSWASVVTSELFINLFFQRVQLLSPADAAYRFLFNVVASMMVNPAVGLFVQHFTAYKLLIFVTLVASVSPLLMMLIDPKWSFWTCAFWAVVVQPVSVDVLFTMAHLIITDVFPSNVHGLAGAVFNTVSQLGASVGMSTIAIVSHSVTTSSQYADKHSPQALMEGYRAAFGVCFVLMVLSCFSAVGLRTVGKLGMGKT